MGVEVWRQGKGWNEGFPSCIHGAGQKVGRCVLAHHISTVRWEWSLRPSGPWYGEEYSKDVAWMVLIVLRASWLSSLTDMKSFLRSVSCCYLPQCDPRFVWSVQTVLSIFWWDIQSSVGLCEPFVICEHEALLSCSSGYALCFCVRGSHCDSSLWSTLSQLHWWPGGTVAWLVDAPPSWWWW